MAYSHRERQPLLTEADYQTFVRAGEPVPKPGPRKADRPSPVFTHWQKSGLLVRRVVRESMNRDAKNEIPVRGKRGSHD